MKKFFPALPKSFSKDTTFDYISQVLACETFAQIAPSIEKTRTRILVIDGQDIASNCEKRLKLLEEEHPEDSYYLREYLRAFKQDIRFRQQKLQEIRQEYQATLNMLVNS